MEEEIDEMTALSLGIGATSQHSKYRRGTGSNPKSHVGFSRQFPDQGDDENSDGHTSKKLRLSDEQATVLEGVYGEHCAVDNVSSCQNISWHFQALELPCYYHREVDIMVKKTISL
jgi:hypothetical protein